MTIIPPHDHFEQDHLDAVVADMRTLGAPTIKAVWAEVYGAWVALEGTHRIRAAKVLGLMPVIDEVAYEPTAGVNDVIPGSYQDDWTLEQIVTDAYSINQITFED